MDRNEYLEKLIPDYTQLNTIEKLYLADNTKVSDIYYRVIVPTESFTSDFNRCLIISPYTLTGENLSILNENYYDRKIYLLLTDKDNTTITPTINSNEDYICDYVIMMVF